MCTAFALVTNQALASNLVDNLKAGKEQTVVCYGTSLTATGQWVADLGKWLNTLDPAGKARATVHKVGLSGQASQTGLNNLQGKVIKLKPDTVIIEFAMNDAYHGPNYGPKHADYGMTPEKSAANLSQMIEEIRTALPETEIIIQTMNSVWDSPQGSGMSAKTRPDLAEYYEGYRKVAKKYNLPVIDHYKNWEKLRENDFDLYKKYIRDGTHPTPEGSTAITFPEVKKVLLGCSHTCDSK